MSDINKLIINNKQGTHPSCTFKNTTQFLANLNVLFFPLSVSINFQISVLSDYTA